MKSLIFAIQLALLSGFYEMASAQDVAGSYEAVSEAGSFTLTLEQKGERKFTGVLAGEGSQFSLQGAVEGEVLTGQMSDGFDVLSFRIVPENEGLRVTLYSADERGTLDPSSGETLMFQRTRESSTPDGSDSRILINGSELSKD